jgi:serine protease Do
MEKLNILLVLIIGVLVIQFGFVAYQYGVIQDLNSELGSLDNAVEGLAQELGTTKSELQGNIDETSAQSKKDISKLTADVIKTQEDLETQSEQLEEQLDKLKASASSDFSGVIEDTIDSVVSIHTDVSQGSGFIITNDGYVVTNYHVIADSSSISVVPYQSSSKSVKLIGYVPDMDIALLKIDGDYNPIDFADSNNVDIGEKVIAMGNPFGLSFSVTEGIVSALDREGSNGLPIYIQTDVPLNPGNSGGPLISKQGKVIGINNFKIGGAESLGFALESNQAKYTINKIAEELYGEGII